MKKYILAGIIAEVMAEAASQNEEILEVIINK